MRDDYHSKPVYQRPKWVTVLAVTGLILGGLGVMTAAGQIIMPKVVEFQKTVLKAMEEGFEKAEQEKKKRAAEAGFPAPGTPSVPVTHDRHEPSSKEVFGMFNKFLDMPRWFSTAMVIFGVIGLLVSFLYIFASIKLFSATPQSVSLFAGAMILGTIIVLAEVVMSVFSNSFMSFVMVGNVLVGAVASFVLFIVAVTADKSGLKPPRAVQHGEDNNFQGVNP